MLGDFIQKHQKVFAWGGFLFLAFCLALYAYWHNSSYKREILQSKAFGKGYFTGEIKQGGGKTSNGPWYACYYRVGDKDFSNYSQPVFRCRPLGRSLFEHSFPVIYNTKKPGQSEVLVFPSDFEEFNLPFPDSLRWVLEYDR